MSNKANKDQILMVVSYYQNGDDSGIEIKSQLNNKELLEIIEMVSSILHAQEESEYVDLSIKEDLSKDVEKIDSTDKKDNIYGDPDLLKVDSVINGSIIDPIKK